MIAAACACREIPKTVLAAVRARGIRLPARRA